MSAERKDHLGVNWPGGEVAVWSSPPEVNTPARVHLRVEMYGGISLKMDAREALMLARALIAAALDVDYGWMDNDL